MEHCTHRHHFYQQQEVSLWLKKKYVLKALSTYTGKENTLY